MEISYTNLCQNPTCLMLNRYLFAISCEPGETFRLLYFLSERVWTCPTCQRPGMNVFSHFLKGVDAGALFLTHHRSIQVNAKNLTPTAFCLSVGIQTKQFSKCIMVLNTGCIVLRLPHLCSLCAALPNS